MSPPLKQPGYEELARRIRAGQVVFFFGAGMSIDGEGNTAARLVTRLLVRFRAISSTLIRYGNGPTVKTAKTWSEDLMAIFALPKVDRIKLRQRQDPEKQALSFQKRCHLYLYNKILSTLGERYYDFNDWVCGAFETLLALLQRHPECDTLLNHIYKKERQLMRLWAPWDQVPLNPISEDLLKLADKERRASTPQNDAGKALFLETMGFRNAPEMMGGEAGEKDHRKAAESYVGKLQERHWIVARFAREGWCPLVLTANFDRLLEGAFRLSGFRPTGKDPSQYAPPVPVPEWATVASPAQFFDMAGQNATALVVKLHGCSKRYEELREPPEQAWQNYLKSMVFTFREIQNWREDAWSRDYLSTLLRTRAMVFCGYSARDPVIHDTLRSVYEEMGKYRKTPLTSESSTTAPAFFFSAETPRDFHGIEILRAATTAATGKGISRDHSQPNYLRHHFRQNAPEKAVLPDTDDVFLWANHLAYRSCQQDFLRQELRSLYSLLIDSTRVDEITIQEVLNDFRTLCNQEQEEVESLPGNRHGHEQLRRLTRWTYRFHPNLLREFACAEAGRMEQGHTEWAREMRLLENYYFPASARPAWTAWGVVIEMALRKVAEHFDHECAAGLSTRASVLFSPDGLEGRLPRELLIHHPGMEKSGNIPRVKGASFTQTVWELGVSDHPWPLEQKAALELERPFFRARGKAPSAKTIWSWLQGKSLNQAAEFIGIGTTSNN